MAHHLEYNYFNTSKSRTDWKIYFVLLQAYFFSDDGATLEEIANTVGQSVKTVRTHIKSYPAERIAANKMRKAHRYKLSTAFIQELEALASKHTMP